MVAPVKHRFVSAKADGLDPTLVTPSSWNDVHGGIEVFATAADQAFTVTTLADITGLSFPIAINEKVMGWAEVYFTSAAATTGAVLGLGGPASPTALVGAAQVEESATTVRIGGVTAYGTLVTGANAVVAPAINKATVSFNIENGLIAGTVALRAASEVAASAVTIKRGSWLRIVRYG